MEEMRQAEKVEALLLGLAIGDALGVPVEFQRRGAFNIRDMQGYGTHNQPAGTWSDDTALTLCLADVLGSGALDLRELAYRFIAWREEALFTANGRVFDIGIATSKAIARLEAGVPPEEAGGRGQWDNGNGSLMRIAPLLFYLRDKSPISRYEVTKAVSSLTHGHPISVLACHIFMEYLRLLDQGRSAHEAYAALPETICGYAELAAEHDLQPFRRILKGEINTLAESAIRSGGYVVDTLEAALWSFLTTDTYREAVLKAVNLGEDTDTTGAVTGAMAGLYYGAGAIPVQWSQALAKVELIRQLAAKMSGALLPAD